MFTAFGIEMVIVFGLASFRLTRLLVFDKITEGLRRPFFNEKEIDGDIYLLPYEKGVRGWIGKLLSCYWCTGIWASGGLLGGYFLWPEVFLALVCLLAIAAVGSIIETLLSLAMDE